MKLLLSLLLVGILSWEAFGCEYHRRLEEMQRRRAAEANVGTEHLRHLATQELRQVQNQAYTGVRNSNSRYALPQQNHGEGHLPSYASTSTLPENSRLCYGSSEYYCHVDAKCVRNDDGSYKCRYEQKYTLSGNPTKVGSEYLPRGHTKTTTTRIRPLQVVPVYGSTRGRTATPIRGRYNQNYVVPSHGSSAGDTGRITTSRRYYPTQGGSDHKTRAEEIGRIIATRRYYPTQNGGYSNPYRPTYRRLPVVTKCPNGYELYNTTNGKGCRDIDECMTEKNNCEGTCKNIGGSFYCICSRGFIREEGYKCVDRDECTEVPGICAFTCINTNGSYECECISGYERSGTKDCVDINECKTNPCNDDEVCFNEIGSYECEDLHTCPEGYSIPVNSTVSNCNLQDLTMASDANPNMIMYRKVLVEAQNRTRSRKVASLTFSNRDNSHHEYYIKVLNGSDTFRYTKKQFTKDLAIDIYSRDFLTAEELYPFIFLITDVRTRTGYRQYYSGNRVTITKRRMEMTMYPMKYPKRFA